MVLAAATLVGATACDFLLTGPPADADLFDAPIPGLTPEEERVFARGDAGFGQRFSPREGLGPIFNAASCASCHSGDGRGRPENVLTRISIGTDPAISLGGPQIQDKATPGARPESVPGGVDVSRRLPPPVFGVGFIEAIPVADILANADPSDGDGDGISGRPNWVTPADFVPLDEPGGGAGPQLGRFSRKGQVSSLLQQISEAYHQDMGITTDFLPVENVNPQFGSLTQSADPAPDPEVPAATVRAVVDYVRMLAAPAPGEDTPTRQRGDEVFRQIGCEDCHVREFRTGASSVAALANQRVVLYSDLLLHDMGDALADNRPDGSATGREWKTPPLWGLRIARDFLNGELFLLHDGRATAVAEAIELHGGEAAASRDAFVGLNDADREALLDFVRSR
ncbi:MAG: thiol oxidoreductase [Gemmatimonadetes bacterium]|nr:thiol oxidoreductase [Gemmatimonadota bacterium]